MLKKEHLFLKENKNRKRVIVGLVFLLQCNIEVFSIGFRQKVLTIKQYRFKIRLYKMWSLKGGSSPGGGTFYIGFDLVTAAG